MISNDKKVLWIHQNLVTPKQPGNSRPAQIINSLNKNGWNIHVITSQTGYMGQGDGYKEPGTLESQNGITLERLNTGQKYSNINSRGRSYLDFMKKAFFPAIRVEKVDVIYASTPPSIQLLLSMFISILRNKPFVLEVRDLWPSYLWECELIKSKSLNSILEFIESFSIYFASSIIVVSPPYLPYIRSF
ncbi:MAG: hypothetical protein D3922_02995, partial [Candidatus Electrothrix sp. AR1]|nr:hypothetical protein [Candidatus Electrothrix sp. AR1]